ncbi:MAG: glycosyltransferase [Sphingobacteriales bacterium]|nr:glycosyltransferase [Sphingobacteriales bacterium]
MIKKEEDKLLKILIAPLNWGLGHATRCIPLIRYLLERGDIEVCVASEGAALRLLQREFPQVRTLEIGSETIIYPKSGTLSWHIARQIPAILRNIRHEHHFLQQLLQRETFHGIISDNRYGMYSPHIPSVIITHQIFLKTAYTFTTPVIWRVLRRWLLRFEACWVPDSGDIQNNLSGDLAHSNTLHHWLPQAKYIGALSRFEPPPANTANQPLKYRLLVLLSGPEPQRTCLEDLLLQQLPSIDGKIMIARGLPQNSDIIPPSFEQLPQHISICNYLDTPALQSAIAASEYVLSRSGYTTVMDLAVFQKKALFIPTPGQTEQEYLAQMLHQRRQAVTAPQHRFDIAAMLHEAAALRPLQLPNTPHSFQEILKAWVEKKIEHFPK